LISQDEFVELVKLRNFERIGRPDYLAYRSRAAAVLAYCAGLWFPEIMSLRRPHWMRDGAASISIEATDQRAPRTVAASPAVIWAVQRFLAERRPRILDDDTPLFACDGGLPLKQEITNALRKVSFAKHRKVGTGELRASFEEAMLRAHRDDPLTYYLVGAAPPPHLPLVVADPPLEDLDRLLRKSKHLYLDGPELWRTTSGLVA
jgi:site-specific recombinase XerC